VLDQRTKAIEALSLKTYQGVQEIQQRLNEIKKKQPEISSTELPTEVDLTDTIKQFMLIFEVSVRERGQNFDKKLRDAPLAISLVIAMAIFESQVLEEGHSFQYYHGIYKWKDQGKDMNYEYVTMIPTGKYEQDGKIYRNFSIIYHSYPFNFPDWKETLSFSRIACREEGSWKTISNSRNN
jgi:hypothetical protein